MSLVRPSSGNDFDRLNQDSFESSIEFSVDTPPRSVVVNYPKASLLTDKAGLDSEISLEKRAAALVDKGNRAYLKPNQVTISRNATEELIGLCRQAQQLGIPLHRSDRGSGSNKSIIENLKKSCYWTCAAMLADGTDFPTIVKQIREFQQSISDSGLDFNGEIKKQTDEQIEKASKDWKPRHSKPKASSWGSSYGYGSAERYVSREKLKALRVLGLPGKAKFDEVKRAYRKLAVKYHPDKNIGNEAKAEDIFKTVSKAYEYLSEGM